jgi:hypothetical protein
MCLVSPDAFRSVWYKRINLKLNHTAIVLEGTIKLSLLAGMHHSYMMFRLNLAIIMLVPDISLM